MPSEYFDYLLGEYGPLAQAAPLPPATVQALPALLPPELAAFLAEQGTGMWLDGRFHFCDPLAFQPVVNAVLEGDAEFRADRTTMFAHTAFGKIMAWNRDHGIFEAELPYLVASCSRDQRQHRPDVNVMSALMGIGERDYGDWYEGGIEEVKPLFRRVRDARGALSPGEVYGFFPALELGGVATVESARRVRALEHLAMLAQIGPCALVDHDSGSERFIRHLGQP